MEEAVKVKAKFRNTSRRFEIRSSIRWSELEALLKDYFGFHQGCHTKYLDDEGELVLLSSQAELEEALRINKKHNGLLRLFITEDNIQGKTTLDHNVPNPPFSGQMDEPKKVDRASNTPSLYSGLAAEMGPELSAIAFPQPPAVVLPPNQDHAAQGEGAVTPDAEGHDATKSENLQKQPENQIPTKNNSCYVNLAEVMAVQLAELRVKQKDSGNNTGTEAASAEGSPSRGWFGPFDGKREPAQNKGKGKAVGGAKKTCYNLLAEEMAQEFAEMNAKLKREATKEQEAEDVAGNIEEESGRLTVESQNSPASPLCTPMVTPTQGCYTTLAAAMAPDLAAVNLQLQRLKLERASTEEAPPINDIEENQVQGSSGVAGNARQMGNQKRPTDDKVDCNNQRQKRAKKHPKKKGCYAQLAEDTAPVFADLNQTLLQQMQNKQKMAVEALEMDGTSEDVKEPTGDKVDCRNQSQKRAKQQMRNERKIAVEALNTDRTLEMVEEPTDDKVDCNNQRPKRAKKHPKKKGCYAQLAEDTAPDFADLNQTLLQQMQNEQKMAVEALKMDGTSETVKDPTDDEVDCSNQSQKRAKQQMRNERNMAVEALNTDRTLEMVEEPTVDKVDCNNQRPKRAKKHPKKKGCYAQLAEDVAPEFAAFNEELQQMQNEQNMTLKGLETDGTSEAVEEPADDKVDCNNQRPKRAKKKKGCYAQLAEDTAPEFAALNKELQQAQNEQNMAVEALNTDGTSEDVKEPADDKVDCNNQRPKRAKKHPKKKGCYAQLAEDIAPDFAALNEELRQMQSEQMMAVNGLETDGQSEVVKEPFIIVNSYHSFDQELIKTPDTSSSSSSGEAEQADAENWLSAGASAANYGNLSPSDVELISLEEHRSNSSGITSASGQSLAGDRAAVKQVVEEYLQQRELATEYTVQLQTTLQEMQAKEKQSQEKVIHKGITCDHCNTVITGIRYKCSNCADYDLCEACEVIPGVHNKLHAFIKLRYHAAGIGRKQGVMVPILKNSPYKEAIREMKQKEKQDKREQKRAAKEIETQERRARRSEEREGFVGEGGVEKEQRRLEKIVEKEQGKDEVWVKRQQRCGAKEWKRQWKDMKRCHKMEKQQLKMTRRRRAEMRLNEEKSKPKTMPEQASVEFLSDASYPDGSCLPPGQKFQKRWIVRNDGTLKWNQWMTFRCIEGNIPIESKAHEHVVIPELEPGQQGEIAVELIAPETSGFYESKWQFVYGGQTFGPLFWCDIEVDGTTQKEIELLLHQDEPSENDKASCPTYDHHSLSDEALSDSTREALVSVLQTSPDEDESGSEYLSSEEVPSAIEKTTSSSASCVMVESLTSVPQTQQSLDVQELEWDEAGWCLDDGAYSDSSDDFMVVPVPPCFHPDTPLNADPVNVTVSVSECVGRDRSNSLPFLLESYTNSTEIDGPTSLPSMSHSGVVSGESMSPIVQDQVVVTEEPCQHGLDLTPRGPFLSAGISMEMGVTVETEPISTVRVTVETEPISTQPSIGSAEALPVPSGPTPPISTTPSHVTIPRGQESEELVRRRDSGDFAGNVVSDALATAIDAFASAGHAAMATVQNLINAGTSVDATATYRSQEDDVQVTVNQPDMDAPVPPQVTWVPPRTGGYSNMERLIEMGFADRRLNQEVLNRHNNELEAAINDLLTINGNDWPAVRH